MPRLVITKGPGVGRDRLLTGECTIGRAADVEFPIEDLGASRRHCRVRPEGGGWVVEDLGSRNGTFVDGQRIVQSAPLVEGTLLRVGGVEMVFRATDVAAPAVPAVARSVPAAPAAAPPAAQPPEKKYDIRPTRRRPGW